MSEHPNKILQKYNLVAKKSFGQNFLCDDHHLTSIAKEVEALIPSPHKVGRGQGEGPAVYEIGAGLGALTNALLASGLTIHAIERDRDLIPILKERFADQIASGHLILHEANATTFDFAPNSILSGNLPYHLTSSFLFKAIELANKGQFLGAVFLVQKEVADRIAAKPNNKVYGMPSVLLQALFDVRIARVVPKGAFWPVPKIDSAVIVLKPKEKPLVSAEEWPLFEKVVKAGFGQRRKKLANAIGSLLPVSTQELPAKRAEELAPEDFVRLIR